MDGELVYLFSFCLSFSFSSFLCDLCALCVEIFGFRYVDDFTGSSAITER